MLLNHIMLNKSYDFALSTDKFTSADVAKNLGISRVYANMLLLELQRLGYLTFARQDNKEKLFTKSDKKWTPQTKKQRPPPLPMPTKVEVVVQPDIAAAWVNPSLRPLGTKWIPIVRSIGLGVKQST